MPMVEGPGAGRQDRRPLLDRGDLKPEERRRIGRALVPLLGWGLAASTVLALLTLWHLIRRGRFLRANLASPRAVRLPEVEARNPTPPTPD